MGINLCAAVLERLVQRTLIALDPIDVSKQVRDTGGGRG